MTKDAGIVPRAVPTVSTVAGSVARALLAARVWPARVPMVAIRAPVLMNAA
jgi:hypothetical protein